jgi:hypothetical protein
VKILPLALIFCFFFSCQKDGEPKIQSCISDSTEIETNRTSTPTNYNNSDRISLRLSLHRSIKVKRIMLKASNISNLLLAVDFYKGSYLNNPDQGQLMGSATGVATTSNSTLTETWFEFYEPVELPETNDSINNGYSVVIRFAGGITLDFGSSSGSVLRSNYRTGAGPTSWNSPDQSNTISFGLGGDVGCD